MKERRKEGGREGGRRKRFEMCESRPTTEWVMKLNKISDEGVVIVFSLPFLADLTVKISLLTGWR